MLRRSDSWHNQDSPGSSTRRCSPQSSSPRVDHWCPDVADSRCSSNSEADITSTGGLSTMPLCLDSRHFSGRCIAAIVLLLLALSALAELLLEGTVTLQLHSATLRAAGGSARLSARSMCIMRLIQFAVVIGIVYVSRRSSCRRSRSRTVVGGESVAASTPMVSCTGTHHCASDPHYGGKAGSARSISALWPMADAPPSFSDSYPADVHAHVSSPAQKEQFHRGSGLLCTLSGWVCVLLGCSSLLGSLCSLLVFMGGHLSTGGVLGGLFSHHGPLGRSSIVGRSLPTLTWLCFEVGASGALYVTCLSLLMLVRTEFLSLLTSRPSDSSSLFPRLTRGRVQSVIRLCGANGAEQSWSHRLRSVFLHVLVLLIAFSELYLNDLPVLWQHRPLALLMGCAFSLNLLRWHWHHGRFTYLYADHPRFSSPSVLIASLLTPAAFYAAFAALTSLSRTLTHARLSVPWTQF